MNEFVVLLECQNCGFRFAHKFVTGDIVIKTGDFVKVNASKRIYCPNCEIDSFLEILDRAVLFDDCLVKGEGR